MKTLLSCIFFISITLSSLAQGSIQDPAGNYYNTDTINGILWMTENLRYEIEGESGRFSEPFEVGCYEGEISNCEQFGMLYSYPAARPACWTLGAGWRLPTAEELTALLDYFNENYAALVSGGQSGLNLLLGGTMEASFNTGNWSGHVGVYPSSSPYSGANKSGGIWGAEHSALILAKTGESIYHIWADHNKKAFVENNINFSGQYSMFSCRCVKSEPANAAEPLVDPRDEKVYQTVEIDGKIWMAENLNYDSGEGSWCYDEKDESCTSNGRLYNWEAAKNACPEGWHLPSKEEWETFEVLFEDDYQTDDINEAFLALMAGGGSGFSAQLGGGRWQNDSSYSFYGLGNYGSYWSSTSYSERGDGQSYTYELGVTYQELRLRNSGREAGKSCRCVKD